MSQDTNPRRQKLESFVADHPDDAFGRYGLAIECARAGDNEAALDHFRKLLDAHPDYVTGHFQYGQLLAKLSRDDEARAALTAGIAAAGRQGDTHAVEEMQAALDALR
jgi:predicted Zn-dependent protease